MLRKKSALAEQCVALLQEEKQLATASAEKKNAVLQTLCKKLQAEKKALVLQLSQCVVAYTLLRFCRAAPLVFAFGQAVHGCFGLQVCARGRRWQRCSGRGGGA
jgi:hypothetical protein